jgi:hypothetical protein
MKTICFFLLSLTIVYAQSEIQVPMNNRVGGSIITKFAVSADTAKIQKLDSGNLANQQITLFNRSTKESLITYTDQQGKYLFDHVNAGSYLLFVDDPAIKQKAVVLNVYAPKSGRNTVKPIVVDRIDNTIKVKKH